MAIRLRFKPGDGKKDEGCVSASAETSAASKETVSAPELSAPEAHVTAPSETPEMPETSKRPETPETWTPTEGKTSDEPDILPGNDVVGTPPALKKAESRRTEGPSFSSAFIDGLIFNNLSLVDFVGLTPIIAGGSTVFNGLVMSCATTVVLLVITSLASAAGRYIPQKIAPAVYTLIASAITAGLAAAGYALFPDVMLALGIIFPLIAVNGITLNRVNNFAGRGLSATVGDALGKGLGFAIVMFAVSSLREIFGYGTFCNISVPFFADHCTAVIAGIPGGFFFMAVFAWAVKFIEVKTGRNNRAKEDEKR